MANGFLTQLTKDHVMANNQKLSVHNTIFYSTANAGYAIFAATSLLGIRKYLPDAQLCILSSGLSDYDRKIIEKNNIDYIELDLTKKFTKSWQYPVDCYYIFAGPEIFIDQGFEYSVYIDGDILCDGDPLKGVPFIKGIGGVESTNGGKYVSVFGDDWDMIRRVWDLSLEKPPQTRVQSGVVYFNNSAMSDIRLLDKAEDLFKKSIAYEIPRKGDDSLFSLIQHVYVSEIDITVLPVNYNYMPGFNSWKNPKDGLIFLHFTSMDKPWENNSYKHKNSKLNAFNPYTKKWRVNLRSVAPRIWLSSITKHMLINKILLRIEHKRTVVARLMTDQIMWICGLKKSLLQRRANYHKAPIRLFWWRNVGKGYINFGDEITGAIIEKIFGYRSEYSTITECELVGAGSVLEMIERRNSNNTVKVWGSGYIEEEHEYNSTKGLEFYAVRGEVTRNRLESKVTKITLGDPGLLANIVYGKAKYKTKKVGVVVHYADFDLPIVRKILHDSRFMLIDPLDEPESVARKISSCRFVFSSSLHGLIFADSFKIPNIHIKFSNNLRGGTYKFEDYYSSTDRNYRVADVDKMFDNSYLDEITASYLPIKNLLSIQRALIRSFPDNIR